MRGVCPLVWVSNIFFKTLMMTMLHFRGEKSFLMKGTMRADEVTRRVGNFVRPTLKKILGAQGPLRPKMVLEAPRPLQGAGFYMKKLVAYLNNFQRKKLFCVQTLTKLPELTVQIFMLVYDNWRF
jgi:hypothetical protein